MDSSTESPLDVLSRAATMLQDNAPLPPSYDEARFHLKCKEMAAAAANGGKWKRERRSRPATATPPAYPLKTAQISQHPEPIDMSTRKMRGSPPSYSQTISAGYINRPSTNQPTNSSITNSNATTDTDMNGGDVAAEDSSMPVIDEHFRRSLGKHYQSVFAPSAASGATSSSPPSSTASTRQRITSNGQTTDDSSSDSAADNNAGSALSVDEHFAKALGDTWLKLQQKEKTASITNGGGGGSSSTNHHHSSSSSSSTMTITTTTNSPLVLVPSSPTEHALLRLNRIEP